MTQHTPHVQFVSPYGGLGLRARSVATAYQRLRDLIDRCGIETCANFAELSVAEPCSEALLLDLRGSPMEGSRFSGGGADPEPGRIAEAIGRFGHVHDGLAAEAWAAFGVPRAVAWHVHAGATWVAWRWVAGDLRNEVCAQDPTVGPMRDRFMVFAERHAKLETDEWFHRTQVRFYESFRLRAAGVVAPEELRSEVHATLSARHATAFLDLRFPHAEPSVTPTFKAMYKDVCDGLGMKLPPGNLRVMSLTKRGEIKARKLDGARELTWSR